MNNANIWKFLRFLAVLMLQVLVLKNIPMGRVNIYIYPIVLLLLPLEMAQGAVLLLAFLLGISIDVFYDTLGLHASVMCLIAAARPGTFWLIEPRGGYEIGNTPTRVKLGWAWFFKYTALLFGLAIFLITILEDLSFSLVWFVRFVLSFGVSMAFLMLFQFIFNPD
jgi:hypothetical protein